MLENVPHNFVTSVNYAPTNKRPGVVHVNSVEHPPQRAVPLPVYREEGFDEALVPATDLRLEPGLDDVHRVEDGRDEGTDQGPVEEVEHKVAVPGGIRGDEAVLRLVSQAEEETVGRPVSKEYWHEPAVVFFQAVHTQRVEGGRGVTKLVMVPLVLHQHLDERVAKVVKSPEIQRSLTSKPFH